MSRRLSIVHWMPVEMYPPTINAARFFADRGWTVSLTTTRNRHSLPAFAWPGVALHRAPDQSAVSPARRAQAYAKFHALATLRLLTDRPDAILYFEPQSSFPVFLASRLRRVPLFIHHHEYHSASDFQSAGMRMARIFHRLEIRALFPRARWISHTNAERLALFAGEHPEIPQENLRVLPNLPPATWDKITNRAWLSEQGSPLRMVYVGSLSLRDTYLEALVEWVKTQRRGAVSLDIYAYNVDPETREYLDSLTQTGDVRWFRDGVAYDDLPAVLREYHVGVVFYRARTVNYRHNASNKLFEYLACGLDVLFSSRMEGVKSFARITAAPRVIEADFEKLDRLTLSTLRNRGDIPVEPFARFADAELERLESAMLTAIEHSDSP